MLIIEPYNIFFRDFHRFSGGKPHIKPFSNERVIVTIKGQWFPRSVM